MKLCDKWYAFISFQFFVLRNDFRKEKVIPYFSLEYDPSIACLEVKLEYITENKVLNIPSWTLQSPIYVHVYESNFWK